MFYAAVCASLSSCMLSRLVAAACLFELLVLATDGAIEVEQDEPYGDIMITATSSFPKAAVAV